MKRLLGSLAFCAAAATPGLASDDATGPDVARGFAVVASQDQFLTLVQGRELTRLGIRLSVSADGDIAGRGFGQPVTGAWAWSDGYFCRDLFYGDQDLGPNCQLVTINGETIRFTSDRGTGIFADFRLR